MHDSKLIKTLSTFNKTELKKVHDFLLSPFVNKNETLTYLFNEIIKYYPFKMDVEINKNKIHDVVFPHEPFDAIKFNLQLSYLLKLIEKYIATNEFMNRSHIQNLLLYKGLEKKNLIEHSETVLIDSNKNLEKSKIKDVDYFLEKFQNERALSLFKSRNNIDLTVDVDYEEPSTLDVYYIASKLRELCDITVMGFYSKKTVELKLADYVFEYVERNMEGISSCIIIQIYYQQLKLFKQPNLKAFKYLIELVKQHKENLSDEEYENIAKNLIAYCHINLLYSTEKEVYSEIGIAIYQDLISHKIIFTGDHKSRIAYLNMINFALRLSKISFIENFIEEYKNRLHIDDQEFYYKRALVTLYNSKKEYKKAIETLLQLNPPNLFFQLDQKQILFMLYYKTKQYAPFETLCDSFNMFLFRKKEQISADHYQLFFNYMNVLRQIFRLKIDIKSHNKEQIEKLKLKIETLLNKTDRILQKAWLKKELDSI